MAAALRIFLLDNDDQIFRIALSRYDRMRRDPASCVLRQFAAQRVRAAQVTIELRDRRPQQILRGTFGILPFNAKGSLDLEALRLPEDARVRTALKFPVVDLPGFQHTEDTKLRFLANGGRWEPTAEQADALAWAALGMLKVKSI